MALSKLRQLPRISYFEPEDPSFDEYIYCSGCRDYVYDVCPQHGPLLILPDTKVPEKTNYPPYVPRAALTIPKAFLHIARSYIPGAGLGVFSSGTLPNGVRFGPYRGVVKKNSDSSYCWQIFDKNNKPSHVVDGGDGHRSNWMRFINCSRNRNEQNLIAFQYKGQIYYRTIKIIPRNTELLVYYGSEAAHGLGIDLRFYNCQPQITEPTITTTEIIKENKLDKDNKPKIGINGKCKDKISGTNTKTNFACDQRVPTPNTSEKVKEFKSAIAVRNNPKKFVSSTQSKFTCHRDLYLSNLFQNQCQVL
ncbi:PREDICTED: histone-lysine N-methyltransferase PRDM9-like [Papilio xuthus]|uniref:Histone-lysine N-methyltransferase PRDM9-like n=1 Tax=Papilio xuthus TaxID=66420 RepID=A0AAJ6Z0D3_PAPXU|nr:PREDICTED: histone-lysine N-methyltransferase PRDM9-like [Papilio xuthus]